MKSLIWRRTGLGGQQPGHHRAPLAVLVRQEAPQLGVVHVPVFDISHRDDVAHVVVLALQQQLC